MVSKLNGFTRSCGVAIALAGTLACESEPKTPTSTTQPLAAPLVTQAAQPSAQPKVFTFAPPVGTRFVRTEKRGYQSSLVGVPSGRREEQELRWQVDVGKAGDQYIVRQNLQHVTMKLNGATVIDGDLAPDAITARLAIDRNGNLTDVHGLENTSQTLRAIAHATMDDADERAVSPAGLKALVAMRYNVLTGDFVGRPSTVGSSWTSPGRPNTGVVSKTLTVERMEPCGKAQCARVRADIKLDAPMVFDNAAELVKHRVRELGGDPSKVQLRELDVWDVGLAPHRACHDAQSRSYGHRGGPAHRGHRHAEIRGLAERLHAVHVRLRPACGPSEQPLRGWKRSRRGGRWLHR